ncbi:Uma2 family endonuclease [Streptomyces sp. NBC_00365]|uniref:Uma2 family endonuclease n=1 Tax=Streptomyces sp. NBC_00365 TaxID=2975726 RepID=UPI00224CF2C4|nr:Uma2 family endonuclease [Streptomyces sp. NBC_00365]MCX5092455.1 Uma2 family endonuclease [Streptomyces sp. NBC_00365]
MSALTVDHDPEQNWDDLVRFWEEMEWPEGSKVEIIEGIVTVAPPPSNAHNKIADKVQRRLYQVIPEDWGVYQTLGTAVPSRDGLYIPDIAVAPVEVLDAAESNYIPAAAAELVVEITSKSNASNDRIKKAAGYAQAGVPLYLLIDRWAPGGPTVTLYGEPKGDVYRVLHAGKFGDVITLPEPFDLTLDTSVFPVD